MIVWKKHINKDSILIVEDEEAILKLLTYNLENEGFKVDGFTMGEQAIKYMENAVPDLIILDIMLPDINGLDLCKMLKSDVKTKHIPIVLLTAKNEDIDIILGLELGADDYITKPFSPRIIAAKIKAILRRTSEVKNKSTDILKFQNMEINAERHEVTIQGEAVELAYIEFRILHLLASEPGRVFTRYQIIESVRGDKQEITDRSVDVMMVGLRKKLGSCSNYIETVWGVGYRFKE